MFISSDPKIVKESTGKYVMGVGCEDDTVNNLHSFRMVNISTSALIVSENSYRLIERTCNEFAACWRIVEVDDGSYVIPMDGFSSFHLPHIERIAVSVLASDREVNRLDRIKSKTWAFIVQINFLNGRLPSKIIQNNRTIDSSSTDDIRL